MENNQKPIVFLSHSSLDKEPLAAIKQVLDKRAAGFLNFFLSSDGESIKFGRNWVVSVSDALSQAKLMFVFLSPQSADSKWIHFEAGCAYAKDIRVVPVCLPGIDLNRITAPLNLLQGFNLHSHEALGNIVRICNERFGVKIEEAFNEEDFYDITHNLTGFGEGFFGAQCPSIDYISIVVTRKLSTVEFNPIPALEEMCKEANMRCRQLDPKDNDGFLSVSVEQAGCEITFQHSEDPQKRQARFANRPVEKGVPHNYFIECKLSPELFHINAPLLDGWFKKVGIAFPVNLTIHFRKQIDVERERHRLTAKLYQAGINLTKKGSFELEGLVLKFSQTRPCKLPTYPKEKLDDKRFVRILEKLFKGSVLWESEPEESVDSESYSY